MDGHTQQKFVEDISYMRGQLDATFPAIQALLEKQDKRIQSLETATSNLQAGQASIRTKVAIFGGLAGAAGSSLLALLIAFIKSHLGLNR